MIRGARGAIAACRGAASGARSIASSSMGSASLAGTYASALFEEASKAQALKEVESDISDLNRLFSITPLLDAFLKDPSTPSQIKADVVNEAAKKIGVGKLASNMISVLAETGRLGNMPGVCGEFLKIASGTRGESSVVVTTFEPLTEAQIGTVKTLVAEILGTKQVEIEAKTDPAILGGMIVEVGDKYIDMSVRTKMRVIEQAMASS